jgi:glycosyltransferase involved in cell wall biosynthesis
MAHFVAEAPTYIADRRYTVFHGDEPEFELYTLPISLPQSEDIDAATGLCRLHELDPGGYIICCGRLTVEKGALDVVSAFAEAKISMPLVLVGTVSPQLRRLINSIDCNEATSNIVLLGEQQHEVCLGLISQAGYFVSASYYEAFGLAVYEAKATGKRALLSRIPAHESAFGSEALYFSVGDVGHLARLFRELKPLDTSASLITHELHLSTEASWQKLILHLYNRVTTA